MKKYHFYLFFCILYFGCTQKNSSVSNDSLQKTYRKSNKCNICKCIQKKVVDSTQIIISDVLHKYEKHLIDIDYLKDTTSIGYKQFLLKIMEQRTLKTGIVRKIPDFWMLDLDLKCIKTNQNSNELISILSKKEYSFLQRIEEIVERNLLEKYWDNSVKKYILYLILFTDFHGIKLDIFLAYELKFIRFFSLSDTITILNGEKLVGNEFLLKYEEIYSNAKLNNNIVVRVGKEVSTGKVDILPTIFFKP